MIIMVFKINNIDFLDCLLQEGLKPTKKDFESSNTQRSKFDGSAYFKVLRTYYKLEIETCIMPEERFGELLSALESNNGVPSITFSCAGDTITHNFRCTERPAPNKMTGYVASTTFSLEGV